MTRRARAVPQTALALGDRFELVAPPVPDEPEREPEAVRAAQREEAGQLALDDEPDPPLYDDDGNAVEVPGDLAALDDAALVALFDETWGDAWRGLAEEMNRRGLALYPVNDCDVATPAEHVDDRWGFVAMDRVRVTRGTFKGCEGFVVYCVCADTMGEVKVALEGSGKNARHFAPDRLEIIEPAKGRTRWTNFESDEAHDAWKAAAAAYNAARA